MARSRRQRRGRPHQRFRPLASRRSAWYCSAEAHYVPDSLSDGTRITKEGAMFITEHVAKGNDHTTFYLASGPSDGPVIIFVHGWPELSITWRHQLPVFGALGFRAVAPDMRGY